MKKLRKFFRPMLVALTIAAIVGAAAFLVLNRANAGSQNTPQGIDGYNIGISGDVQVDLKNVQTHASDVQA